MSKISNPDMLDIVNFCSCRINQDSKFIYNDTLKNIIKESTQIQRLTKNNFETYKKEIAVKIQEFKKLYDIIVSNEGIQINFNHDKYIDHMNSLNQNK